MAKKFQALLGAMPEARREHIAAQTQRLMNEMPLQDLRRALDLTQQQVAASLGINQVAISKMESQTDMYISTLRRFIEAMGGQLRIVAQFPQGPVEITQFKQTAESTERVTTGDALA
jgi:transcriptional regulator with XRE-family HTH domain